MRIRVLYFGALRDKLPDGQELLEIADKAIVADVLSVYRERVPGFAWDAIAVAVNQEYAQAGDVLKDGDEVALLPPVSGGYGKDQKQSEIQGSFPIRLRSGSGWQGFGVDRGKGRNAGRDY
jgi:molybdopterin converting factor subunit 1